MIGRRLMQAGLIQFGAFPRSGQVIPFDLSLHLIGSYPPLLRDLAALAAEQLRGIPVTRLLAASDSVPFGVALSLATDVPLVYSKGLDASPVDDLVGAYDIGHPAVLVTHSVGFDPAVEALVKGARRVGLEVHTLVTVLECGSLTLEGIEIKPLIRLSALVDDLVASGDVPRGQGEFVKQWINAGAANR